MTYFQCKLCFSSRNMAWCENTLLPCPTSLVTPIAETRPYTCETIVWERAITASLLCPIPFHVKWNKTCLDRWCLVSIKTSGVINVPYHNKAFQAVFAQVVRLIWIALAGQLRQSEQHQRNRASAPFTLASTIQSAHTEIKCSKIHTDFRS